jgi:6-phosphogluconolactonase
MRPLYAVTLFSFASFLFFSCGGNTQQATSELNLRSIYVGTYTRSEGHVDGKAEGIYRLSVDQDMQLRERAVAARLINPSFVALATQSEFLFAVSETGADDAAEGSLHSFKVLEDGQLEKVDSVGTGGFYPCHVISNQQEDLVIAANYVGGAVSVFTAEEGKLSLLQKLSVEGSGSHWRQEASHTHMSMFSPSEKFLYVVDLGANVIWNFRWDDSVGRFVKNEQQAAFSLPEGAGPRHMEFHPDGKLAAVISELNNTVSLLSYSEDSGELELLDTQLTIDELDSGVANATADIHFHPSGKFLYGSNRGENSIVMFELKNNSQLVKKQSISTMGAVPRNFAISESGDKLWVANQNSDNVSVYEINPDTGQLTSMRVLKDIMTPVCITGL